jgi:SMI1 / KNR4 family (SUKH-1)
MATLVEILSDSTAKWMRRPRATEPAIQALIANCGFALPEEYLSFLRYSNGGEGFLCIEPWYFQLCPAEEVIAYNQGYNVEEFLPGWFAIGSNGGGELLSIRKRDGSPCPVYMVPFIPMAESDAVQIAHDFKMFAMTLGRDGAEA